MKIPGIKVNNIHPTDKKINQAKKVVDEFAALPKEMPLEPKIKFNTLADRFENVKNSILVAIDNMRNG